MLEEWKNGMMECWNSGVMVRIEGLDKDIRKALPSPVFQ
jgi:hypothetical protein